MFKANKVVIISLLSLFIVLLISACGAVSYDLTLDANGGEFDTGNSTYIIKTDGKSAVTFPSNPSREGFTFGGWFLDNGTFLQKFATKSLLSSPIQSDITVYARWIEDTIITFHANGGSVVSSMTAVEGATISAPTMPTRVGHTFAGWYTDNGTFLNEYTFTTMPAESFSLYAKWSISSYTLTLNKNIQGAGEVVGAGEKDYNSNVIIAATTNKYYEWLGWYQGDNLISRELSFNFSMPAQVITYEARWISEAGTEGLQYSLIGDGTSYSVSKGTATDNDISIPIEYNGLPVTQIANNAFMNYINLTSIVIPDGVISIGHHAFFSCDIISIIIPDSVTHIGSYAFSNCANLTTVFIERSSSASITAGESNMFDNCHSSLRIYVPDEDSVTVYQDANYWSSYSSKIYAIQYNTFTITFFDSASVIDSITEEEGATISAPTLPIRVGHTFAGWYTDNGTFLNEYTLTTMPAENLTVYAKWSINSYTLTLNKNIQAAGEVIGAGQKEYDVNVIITATINNGYIWLGWYQAGNLISEELSCNFSMPAQAITYEARWMHEGTEGLLYTLIGDETAYSVSLGTATDNNIIIPLEHNGLPVSVIADEAFMYYTNLTSIFIPDSITSIGSYAFYYCGFISITIPSSVTNIDSSAFYDCNKLTEFIVAIENTSYQSIDGVLYNKAGTTLIQYPIANTRTTYSIPYNVTDIGMLAFCSSSLTSITIPDSVTNIGNYTFSYCSDLTTITIPDSVSYIGHEIFSNCTNLTDIIVEIDNTAYQSIDGVLFDKSGTTLIQYPLGNIRTTYTIPENVIEIEMAAFSNCINLISVTIPQSVTCIRPGAFNTCSSLASITIPDSVTFIGSYAFSNCTSLTTVNINRNSNIGITTGGSNMFNNCHSSLMIYVPDEDSVTAYQEATYWSLYSSKIYVKP